MSDNWKKKGPVKNIQNSVSDNIITAILVDGGFFRKRIRKLAFAADPQKSADELDTYCHKHLTEYINGLYHNHNLYRIFYYDCPPNKYYCI